MARPGAIGEVEAAFLVKLAEVFESLKLQMIANTEVQLEQELKDIVSGILSEEFNKLVGILIAAGPSSSYRFSGSSDMPDAQREIGGQGFYFDNYMYPALTRNWVKRKKKWGYTGAASFKGQRYKQNPSTSLVGVMKALAKNRESGDLLLEAFGYRLQSSRTDQMDYLSQPLSSKNSKDYTFYEKNAERKRKELARKKGPI